MKFQNIHIIINPAAGEEEPILSYLNNVFLDSGINWGVSIMQKDQDVKKIVSELMGKTDLIAVYGGDGSIIEVAQSMIGGETPMAILPGGTANVMAKELGIPTDIVAAIALLKSDHVTIRTIDTGLVNGHPFMLRVNFGVMADMVTHTGRELKHMLGRLAYGITTIRALLDVEPVRYKMMIDGNEIIEEGVSLTVTNSGNIGIEGYSFLPGISVEDGLLDVILLNHANLSSVLKVAGSTLLQSDSEVLKKWKCKEITISLDQSQKYVCDDMEKEGAFIQIEVVPHSLKVLIPTQKTDIPHDI